MSEKVFPYIIRNVHLDNWKLSDSELKATDELRLSSGFAFEKSVDANFIKCLSRLAISKNNGDFIAVDLSCIFEIEQQTFESMFSEDRKSFTIPKNFCQYMASIAEGASRGVITAKLDGTELEQFVLPPINLTKTITTDAEFKL